MHPVMFFLEDVWGMRVNSETGKRITGNCFSDESLVGSIGFFSFLVSFWRGLTVASADIEDTDWGRRSE
jgi:hypothetical protein